jgi:hypothetical protein
LEPPPPPEQAARRRVGTKMRYALCLFMTFSP